MASENTHFSSYALDRIFKGAKNIFFVGIGGISMSSLAEYCIRCGKRVFGYDAKRGRECERLEGRAHIRYCSTTDSVMGMDLVIFSNAIDKSCFELQTAMRLGIPCVSRANFLAYIMSDCRVRIGVAGAHGKSTTTSMLSHIFKSAGKDMSALCGAYMNNFDAPFYFGGRDYFIFEACEYMNSFLSLSPSDAVITNIEFDHPDFFNSYDELLDSFKQYILCAKRVFINADDHRSAPLKHPFKVTFGIKERADYTAKIDTGGAKNAFSVSRHGIELAKIELREFGRHNVYNALCAFSVAHTHKIEPSVIAEALSSFEGAARRQELVKRVSTLRGDVPLYLDYAHHPTEIRASLDAFSDMGFKNPLCIFQSHTYSRTYALYSQFVSAFEGVKELICMPIFSAREQNVYGISDEKLAEDMGAIFMSDKAKIAERVRQSNADCVVIMGAGDIENLKNYIN
ncbi:MAG: UDP-N-acetylmuramate--L-alanine ligase [Ruminococcaceae bacterium]|nr:UDP-N-acetylmuramate--L-alanine ligase [Oscillospiraceae bacterium]